jgi:hypothetical protein
MYVAPNFAVKVISSLSTDAISARTSGLAEAGLRVQQTPAQKLRIVPPASRHMAATASGPSAHRGFSRQLAPTSSSIPSKPSWAAVRSASGHGMRRQPSRIPMRVIGCLLSPVSVEAQRCPPPHLSARQSEVPSCPLRTPGIPPLPGTGSFWDQPARSSAGVSSISSARVLPLRRPHSLGQQTPCTPRAQVRERTGTRRIASGGGGAGLSARALRARSTAHLRGRAIAQRPPSVFPRALALRRPSAGDAPWRLPQGAGAQPRSGGGRGCRPHLISGATQHLPGRQPGTASPLPLPSLPAVPAVLRADGTPVHMGRPLGPRCGLLQAPPWVSFFAYLRYTLCCFDCEVPR